ncbi:hypothetical protein OESDEN_09328 [Oesophagostomum dentatum]|uniref:7TM chemoreceptor n=1 Tax=Oesophagostomum dentatum TaxID=61180 RepID=A0A0B1T4U1_OESDE|nr:hypothetical protein OESDEN_09328 [Oesophagostomum dentatum]
MLHTYSHWLYSILFSFCYRYYVISHPPPKVRTITIIILIIYIPSFVQFMIQNAAHEPEEAIRARVVQIFDYDISNECVTGHLNIIANWRILYAILHMSLPFIPVYTTILILRTSILKALQGAQAMSEKSRRLHSQLLKALTYQAFIPLFFSLALITYFLGQFSIINHPVLEYSSYIIVGFIPVLSPLTSFYFIRPYREWVDKNLIRSLSTAKTFPTSVMASSEVSQHF